MITVLFTGFEKKLKIILNIGVFSLFYALVKMQIIVDQLMG